MCFLFVFYPSSVLTSHLLVRLAELVKAIDLSSISRTREHGFESHTWHVIIIFFTQPIMRPKNSPSLNFTITNDLIVLGSRTIFFQIFPAARGYTSTRLHIILFEFRADSVLFIYLNARPFAIFFRSWRTLLILIPTR